jgi:putative ABC transport system permease protein
VNQLRISTTSHDEQSRLTVARDVEKALIEAGIPVWAANSISRSEAISAGHPGPVILVCWASPCRSA